MIYLKLPCFKILVVKENFGQNFVNCYYIATF